MAAKKTVKKAVKKVAPVLSFDKKNVLALADSIYTDKAGVVSFLKLCHGTLANGKDGGRTLHCAVGEAYFNFVSRDMRSVLNVKGEKDESGCEQDYHSDLCELEGETGAAVDRLVAVAKLKKDSSANKLKLANALADAVGANDYADDDVTAFAERSRQVAETLRTKVAPLLK